jgi:SAM-dependent methyltransferase
VQRDLRRSRYAPDVSWLFVLLGALFVLDGLRLRARVAKVPTLVPTDDAITPGHVFLIAPGVKLADATRRAASAHARTRGLDVLDLIPADSHVQTRLGLAALVDPATYRARPFAPGRTVGYAMLATTDVLARARHPVAPRDIVAFHRLAATLKLYASTTCDFAVAPELHAPRRDPSARRAVFELVFGEFYVWAMLIPLAIAALLGYGLATHPLHAGIAIACYHLGAAIALAGVAHPRDLELVLALRLPLDTLRSIALVCDRWAPARAEVDELRPIYARLLAGGWQKFFEPPVTACVHCGAGKLKKLFTTGDHFQQKPGRFTIVRCRSCGVVFQNPRLNREGLAFYYRDYYDGMGADITELAFSNYGPVYVNRANMMKALTRPQRWLDVGCGHGHFCRAARDALPGTELHGLDWGTSVDDAQRRGWIDRAHRGSLPDLASALRRRYDVVSMFHYLEHVIDPAAEIAAAREVLEPGGYLVIEVPEPDSLIGRALGSFWVNWLQPQHLQFLSIRHVDALLRAHGFTPVTWHRSEAHMPIDLSWATILLLQRLGPLTDKPWKPPSTALQRLRRRLVWTVGAPIVFGASLVDRLLAVFARPLHSWNLYRVAARLDHPRADAPALPAKVPAPVETEPPSLAV